MKFKISDILENPENPRTIKNDKFEALVNSILVFPKMMSIRPIVVDDVHISMGGNMRSNAVKEIAKMGEEKVHDRIIEILEQRSETDEVENDKIAFQNMQILRPIFEGYYPEGWVKVFKNLNESERREFILKDNSSFGDWDYDELANKFKDWELEEADIWRHLPEDLDFEDEDVNEPEQNNKLSDIFVIPPFSVLDTRQGYWNERKRYWKELIGENGESREFTLSKGNKNLINEINSGVSILDPVVAEIANKWFGLNNCKTFDCFAGDSIFGYVSDALGNTFTGIELRKEQAELNNSRLRGSKSKYICDDGQNVLKHIKPETQDLLFSCPPYFDLEVYSELENDASNQNSYEDFLKILKNAFTNSIKCLKNNRFAFIVVGDLRENNGGYYNLPNDIKNIFFENDLILYNEMILVEPLGTLPQRVKRFMGNRKIGKCHQNILVFYKGDINKIKNIFPKIDFNISEEEK